LSAIPGLDGPSMAVCLKAFYATLFTLSMPTFERLTSPRVRVRGRRGTSQVIASAYVVGVWRKIMFQSRFLTTLVFCRQFTKH
jgi:hypothetical protein